MTVVLVWLLLFMGFVAIAAAMERHQDELGTQGLSAAQLRGWRAGGWLLLALALVLCLQRWSTSIALAAWTGLLPLAGLTLGLLFTYAPKVIRALKSIIAGFVNNRGEVKAG